jgi:hypothetical protein
VLAVCRSSQPTRSSRLSPVLRLPVLPGFCIWQRRATTCAPPAVYRALLPTRVIAQSDTRTPPQIRGSSASSASSDSSEVSGTFAGRSELFSTRMPSPVRSRSRQPRRISEAVSATTAPAPPVSATSQSTTFAADASLSCIPAPDTLLMTPPMTSALVDWASATPVPSTSSITQPDRPILESPLASTAGPPPWCIRQPTASTDAHPATVSLPTEMSQSCKASAPPEIDTTAESGCWPRIDKPCTVVVPLRTSRAAPCAGTSSTVPSPSVSATIVTFRSVTRLSGYTPGEIATTPPAAAALIAAPMVRWLPQPRVATRWGGPTGSGVAPEKAWTSPPVISREPRLRTGTARWPGGGQRARPSLISRREPLAVRVPGLPAAPRRSPPHAALLDVRKALRTL